jgi:hypothetical protein
MGLISSPVLLYASLVKRAPPQSGGPRCLPDQILAGDPALGREGDRANDPTSVMSMINGSTSGGEPDYNFFT